MASDEAQLDAELEALMKTVEKARPTPEPEPSTSLQPTPGTALEPLEQTLPRRRDEEPEPQVPARRGRTMTDVIVGETPGEKLRFMTAFGAGALAAMAINYIFIGAFLMAAGYGGYKLMTAPDEEEIKDVD